MVLPRASKQEYDSWVTLGNPGWGWDDLVPYFKKAETFLPATPDQVLPGVTPKQQSDAAAGLNQYLGFSGPIQVGHSKFSIIPLTFNA